MLEKLKALLAGSEKSGAPEQEALVDAVVFVMYADHALMLEEEDTLDDLPQKLAWKSKLAPRYYLQRAIPRVREALADEEKTEAFLESVAARITTAEMKGRVLETCERMASADGRVVKEEREFIERLREKLNRPRPAG